MRLRKAPYTQFRRVSTSLDNFTIIDSSPVFMLNNDPHMDLELKENDLISFMNPKCPQCRSKNVVRNGTCSRNMENGTVFRMNTGEESIKVKLSSDVETLLNSVYGAFRSRM